MWKETEIGNLPSDWNVTQLGEICTLITDGSHFSPKEEPSKYFMASVKDMRYNYFEFADCKTISEKDFNSLVQGNCSPIKGDIIISKDGANCLDLIFVYDQPDKIVLLSSIAIARLKKGFDSHFLMYYLLSPTAQYLMRNNFVSGSAIPRVVLKDFRKVLVPSIPYEKQFAISSVLKSLDDKIALLHRQNKTLEQLAETLFKQWFVEEAQEGWEEKGLVEIAEYLNGLALQKFPAKGINDLHVIKIREMKQGISDNTDKCSNDIPSQYIIQNGDILFSWSGSLEVVIWYDGEGALNQHLFKVSSDKYPKWFYYLATKHHLANFKMIAESKSTTMGHIQREHLREAIISIPPKEIFTEYDKTIEPLIEKKIKNNSQIKTLTKLRDTLLPKLMSGEATVND